MPRLFDSDPITKTRRIFHDNGDGTYTIETQADVEDIVDEAKTLDRCFRPSDNWRGDMHKVATIPISVLMTPEMRKIIRDPKAFKRWLNDPDNRVFRTRPGRV